MPSPIIASVGGSIGSSLIGASSASKAANAQVQASREANALQKEMYERNIELGTPWYMAATGVGPNGEKGQNIGALNALQYELGLGPMPGAAGAPSGGSGLSITEIPGTGPQLPSWQKTTPDGMPLPPGGLASLDGDDRRDWFQRYAPARDDVTGELINPSTPSKFSVNGQTFDTREAAQAYIDAQGGGGGTTGGFEYKGFQETPGYNYLLEQGTKAIDRAAAARGVRRSGATMIDQARHATGLASQEYNNWLNRVSGMAGAGQTQASQNAMMGQNYANAAGTNINNAGAARASGYMGVNNALQGGIGNLFSVFGMNQAGAFGGGAQAPQTGTLGLPAFSGFPF